MSCRVHVCYPRLERIAAQKQAQQDAERAKLNEVYQRLKASTYLLMSCL